MNDKLKALLGLFGFIAMWIFAIAFAGFLAHGVWLIFMFGWGFV